MTLTPLPTTFGNYYRRTLTQATRRANRIDLYLRSTAVLLAVSKAVGDDGCPARLTDFLPVGGVIRGQAIVATPFILLEIFTPFVLPRKILPVL